MLSNPSRRATYDRDVLRLHEQQQQQHAAGGRRHGSYHSTSAGPAGGRTASGLSRRRGTFRGPPTSFYRSGGWGAHSEKRQRAHDESTNTGASSSSSGSANADTAGAGAGRANPWHHPFAGGGGGGGMGPGSQPFGRNDDVPHFDSVGHERTQKREDERRWQRGRRAVGDDDVEFEPQMSLGAHFLVVVGLIAVSFAVPAMYIRWARSNRKKKELGN